MRTVFALGVLALSVATLQSAFAAGPSGRFVEFHSPGGWTDIYDIETVRMILPGRFTVIKTTIDDPDKIPLKLDIFRILKTYCERPEGNYRLPQKLVTMAGLPTSSVFKVANETIEVMSVDEELKTIYWANWSGFPVGSWIGLGFLCKPSNETEVRWYARELTRITNGEKTDKLFDCKRGLVSNFMKDGDDPARVALSPIRGGSRVDEEYLRVCSEVTHEVPYVPK